MIHPKLDKNWHRSVVNLVHWIDAKTLGSLGLLWPPGWGTFPWSLLAWLCGTQHWTSGSQDAVYEAMLTLTFSLLVSLEPFSVDLLKSLTHWEVSLENWNYYNDTSLLEITFKWWGNGGNRNYLGYKSSLPERNKVISASCHLSVCGSWERYCIWQWSCY